MDRQVVITGIGLVTPLGQEPGEVLDRMAAGQRAASTPAFDASGFSCRLCATVDDFDVEPLFPENKTLRLMNRDAQMAVVAARRAMQDAGIQSGHTYPSEEIGLFGATGMTSLPIDEARRLVEMATDEAGRFDLARFGRVTLRRTRPVLSFKILANMPICFVSIFEQIRGPNAVYTPWEGQGAQAIAAGFEAVRRGDVPCALVGGCDVKTRLMSFLALEKLGAFASWKRDGCGFVPGEGAAFLVLENEEQAAARSARCYARVRDYRTASTDLDADQEHTRAAALDDVDPSGDCSMSANVCHCLPRTTLPTDTTSHCLRSSAGTTLSGKQCRPGHSAPIETPASSGTPRRVEPPVHRVLCPKAHLGDLYAAAAAVQVGLGAAMLAREPAIDRVVAECVGFGTEQAVFLLEAP